jgi:hypothetical protein
MPEEGSPPNLPVPVPAPNAAPPAVVPEQAQRWPILRRETRAGEIEVDPGRSFKQGVLSMTTDFVKAHPWSRELTNEQKQERWQELANHLTDLYQVPRFTVLYSPPEPAALPSPTEEGAGPVVPAPTAYRVGHSFMEFFNAEGQTLETPIVHLDKFSLLNLLTIFRMYQLKTEFERRQTPAEEEPEPMNMVEIYRQSVGWATALFYRASPRRFLRQVHKGQIMGIDPDSVTNFLGRTQHVAGPACPGCRMAEERANLRRMNEEQRQMFASHEEAEQNGANGNDMYM